LKITLQKCIHGIPGNLAGEEELSQLDKLEIYVSNTDGAEYKRTDKAIKMCRG
jgi:hypothetical protein